jgi:hypothetical protein
VFGWRCRFLAEGLANRFNIPLENLIHLPYHELEAITALGTAADVTSGARQFLDNAAIIPRLFRENPLAALQALQEFGCRNNDTVLGQMALTLSRTYPQILNPGAPAPPGPPGWRLPPWLIPVAGGVAVGVGAAILWDELTRIETVEFSDATQSRRYGRRQTCDDAVLDQLHSFMRRLCDRPRNCDHANTCGEIYEHIANGRQCINARANIRDVCFGGIDDQAHIRELEAVQRTLRGCISKAQRLNCQEY